MDVLDIDFRDADEVDFSKLGGFLKLSDERIKEMLEALSSYREIIPYTSMENQDRSLLHKDAYDDLEYALQYICNTPTEVAYWLAQFGKNMTALSLTQTTIQYMEKAEKTAMEVEGLYNQLLAEKKAIERGKLTVKSTNN